MFERRHARSAERVGPRPNAVQESVIATARLSIESAAKRRLRACLVPFKAWQLNLGQVAEGFQWGTALNIAGAEIGRYAYVGHHAEFQGIVRIGDLAMIAARCTIVGNDHLTYSPTTPIRLNFNPAARPVTLIDCDAWIGQGVTICEGVQIGRGSVIGAGSVVTQDVPPYTIWAGSPARMIRPRFDNASARLADLHLFGRILPDLAAILAPRLVTIAGSKS